MGIPEYRVPLPGGSTPSQNDILVLARTPHELITIAVEGKVDESFGPPTGQRLADASVGQLRRYDFLRCVLGMPDEDFRDVRYQLLHRTASALLTAELFHAQSAVMLIHWYPKKTSALCFEDYRTFVSMFGLEAEMNTLNGPVSVHGIDLYFGWVTGDPIFLTK